MNMIIEKKYEYHEYVYDLEDKRAWYGYNVVVAWCIIIVV